VPTWCDATGSDREFEGRTPPAISSRNATTDEVSWRSLYRSTRTSSCSRRCSRTWRPARSKGFTYEVFRLEDGVSFVHVVIEHDIGDRCDVPPLAMGATVVGGYH
jgi:hypothetical protein